MRPPVSRTTEQALRAAMERLFAGRAVKTDGRLTVVNLAIEAGVSRATANRAADVLADYWRAAAVLKASGPIPEVAHASRGEESRNAHVLAQHIQVRARHRRQEERRATRADILPFRRNTHDHHDTKGGETL
jgi:hypothetical protein